MKLITKSNSIILCTFLALFIISFTPLSYGDSFGIISDELQKTDNLIVYGKTTEPLSIKIQGNDFEKSYLNSMVGNWEIGIPLDRIFHEGIKPGQYKVTLSNSQDTLTIPIGIGVEPLRDCLFNAYIEKNHVLMGERPWISGFIKNCDNGIEYHNLDRVYVSVLDSSGEIVKDDWKPRKSTTKSDTPQTFVFTEDVYRGGFRGNADVSQTETIHIKNNQYFFYLPQINEIDFEENNDYSVQLRYNDEIKTVSFKVIMPYIENIECDNSTKTSLENTLKALQTDKTRYDLLGKYYDTSAINSTISQIESFEECK